MELFFILHEYYGFHGSDGILGRPFKKSLIVNPSNCLSLNRVRKNTEHEAQWICGGDGRRAAPGFSLHSEGMECVIGVSNPLKHKHTMWKAGSPDEAAMFGFWGRERERRAKLRREREGLFLGKRGFESFSVNASMVH